MRTTATSLIRDYQNAYRAHDVARVQAGREAILAFKPPRRRKSRVRRRSR